MNKIYLWLIKQSETETEGLPFLFAVYLIFGGFFVSLAGSPVLNADESTVVVLEVIWAAGLFVMSLFAIPQILAKVFRAPAERRAKRLEAVERIIKENREYLNRRK